MNTEALRHLDNLIEALRANAAHVATLEAMRTDLMRHRTPHMFAEYRE